MLQSTPLNDRTLFWLRQTPLIVLALFAVYVRYTLIHQFGPWLTPDTANYFSTVANLLAGNGFVQYDGAQLVQYAPFYPIILAELQLLLGLKPFESTQILNAVLFGAIVYLGGFLFFRHLKSPVLAFLGTLSLFVSRPLFEVTLMAMSELPFIALSLLFLVLIELYQKSPRVWKLVVAGVVVSLAALTRYVGAVLIPIGILALWFVTQSTRRERLGAVVIFTIASLPFIGAWVVRTYILTGQPFGGRGNPLVTVDQATSLLFNVIFGWYAPNLFFATPIAILILAVIVALIVGNAWLDNWKSVGASFKQHGSLILFCVCYTAIVFYQDVTSNINPLENRLLSPLVVPLGVLILVWFEMILHRIVPAAQFFFATTLLAVAIAGWLPYPQSNLAELSNMYVNHQGIGWNNSYWNVSPTIAYLRQNPLNCPVYSNGPDILWLQAEIQSKVLTKSNMAPVFRKVPSVCVVWFDGVDRGYVMTLDELKQAARVVPVVELKGGGIYTATFNSP